MEWMQGLFTKYPELAVYLSLGVGYWVGGRKIRGFALGGATGALLAGIVIGMFFKVPITSMAKSVVFLLFMFGIGYSVGPKFFKAMKGEGWRFAVIGIVVPVVGLGAAYVVAKILKLDVGFAAGLFSGGLTESPAIGTASEAIEKLGLDADTTHKLVSHVAIADALTYVFGAFGVIFVCGTLGPKLLGIDVRAESEKLEAKFGVVRTKAGVSPAWQPFETRAYRLDASSPAAGKTVAAAERSVAGTRAFVQRIRRGAELLDPSPDTVLAAGDVVAVMARREFLAGVLGDRATEVDDRELLSVPVARYDVFVNRPGFAGRTLEEIAGDKEDIARSVFLRKLMRGSQEIPIGTRTVIERGDVLTLEGSEAAVDRAALAIGPVIRSSDPTDFVAVGIAIFIGTLVGASLFVPVGGTRIFLGTSVGTLLAGVVTGWLRTVRPIFGQVPDGAVTFMQSLGLSGFVAMIGLGAGPEFIPAVKEAGVGLLIGGVFVTLIPQIAALYFGRYVLRANPVMLLGALAGAQTFTPGLAAVQEKSGSPIAVLGYTGAVPLGHVLLTTGGTIMVMLMSHGT
jgi:putative transport protein